MKTVFIAEDMDDNFNSIKIVFEEALPQCVLRRAKNGKEIVEMIEKEPKPDLILMDMLMPFMDGVEATLRVRKKYSKKELPIIALTAQDVIIDRQIVFDAGCNEYLSKPFTIAQMMEKVNFYLEL